MRVDAMRGLLCKPVFVAALVAAIGVPAYVGFAEAPRLDPARLIGSWRHVHAGCVEHDRWLKAPEQLLIEPGEGGAIALLVLRSDNLSAQFVAADGELSLYPDDQEAVFFTSDAAARIGWLLKGWLWSQSSDRLWLLVPVPSNSIPIPIHRGVFYLRA